MPWSKLSIISWKASTNRSRLVLSLNAPKADMPAPTMDTGLANRRFLATVPRNGPTEEILDPPGHCLSFGVKERVPDLWIGGPYRPQRAPCPIIVHGIDGAFPPNCSNLCANSVHSIISGRSFREATSMAQPQRTLLNPPAAPQPIGAYSLAVDVRADRLLFVAGQVALDQNGNLVGKGDAAA